MSAEMLGVLKPWQVKDFRENLRNRIITAARDAGQTVGEYVTAAMLAYLDGAEGAANPVNRAPRVDLVALLAAARPDKLPREVVALINDKAREARGLPPRKPGKRRLAAPAAAE